MTVLEEDMIDDDPAEIALHAAVNQIQSVTIERIEHETACDPTLQQLIDVIQHGFPSCKDLCPVDVKEFFRFRDYLSVCTAPSM